LISKL
jgi:hypothetical protein